MYLVCTRSSIPRYSSAAARVGFWHIVVRTVVPEGLAVLGFIGRVAAVVNFLFIFGPRRLCLHDMIAGTKAVITAAESAYGASRAAGG